MPNTQTTSILSLPPELISLITARLPPSEQGNMNLLCKSLVINHALISKIAHTLKIYFPHYQELVVTELAKASTEGINLFIKEDQISACVSISQKLFHHAFAEKFQGLKGILQSMNQIIWEEFASAEFNHQEYLMQIREIAFEKLITILPKIKEIEYDVLDFAAHHFSLKKDPQRQLTLLEIQKNLVQSSKKILLEKLSIDYAHLITNTLVKICRSNRLSELQTNELISKFKLTNTDWKLLSDFAQQENLPPGILNHVRAFQEYLSEFSFYRFQFNLIQNFNHHYPRLNLDKMIKNLLQIFDCHSDKNSMLISDVFYYALFKEKLDSFTKIVSIKVCDHFIEETKKNKKKLLENINHFFLDLVKSHLEKNKNIADLTLTGNDSSLNLNALKQQVIARMELLYQRLSFDELEDFILSFSEEKKLPKSIILGNNPTTAQIYTSFKQDKFVELFARSRKNKRIKFVPPIKLHTLLEWKDRLGWSPLVWASQLESNRILHQCYLYYAGYRNQTNGFETISIFGENLDTGVDIQIIHWSIACNHFEKDLCEEYLENDSREREYLSYKDFNERSILHYAVGNKQLSWCCYLVPRLKKIGLLLKLCNEPDNEGYTPIERAANLGNWYAVHVLLKNGAPYTPKLIELMKKPSWFVQDAESATTPLHIAAAFFTADELHELLNASIIPVATQDYQGNTPLHIAFNRGNPKIIALMQEETASNIVNCLGLTAKECRRKDLIELPLILQELQQIGLSKESRNLQQSVELILQQNRGDLMDKLFKTGVKVTLEEIVQAHECKFKFMEALYLNYLTHNLTTCFKANPLLQCLQRMEFWYEQRSAKYKKQVNRVPLFKKIFTLLDELRKNKKSPSFFLSDKKNKPSLSSLKNIHDPQELAQAFINILFQEEDSKNLKNKPKK